jgi:hypothetical protein
MMKPIHSAASQASNWESQHYDRELLERVWEHGQEVQGNDSALWRKDEFGAWIHRLEYGNRRSEYGWEILDLTHSSSGGAVIALRPLHWQNYIDQVAAHTQSRTTASGLRNTRQLL